jgi:multicomponent Na+:H+ antiporter subunit E
LLLGLGALSALLVVTIALRMDVVDREGHPIHLGPGALLYWPWLGWEIVKANLDVARRILDPRLPISPTVIRLKASQKSDLGRVIYANSITLTPGTVSIDIDGERIEVHALTREAAQALRTGDMDRRVTRFEGDE